MGLCKCPKRRVTNQFCFEHRVNVCEHCMVTNHPKVSFFFLYFMDCYKELFGFRREVKHVFSLLQCIVQSYLQWLQDSDYNPICELCTKELATEDCVRLICYRELFTQLKVLQPLETEFH
jgi:hypothetical protein